MAEGRIHPAGGQRGGPRQQVASTREGAGCRAGAFHVLYWTGRTYLRKGAESLQGKTFDESLVPKVEPAAAPASVGELETLKAERDAAEASRKEIESELEALRERLAAIKAENEGVPETHDWNEDKTRKLIIDLAPGTRRLAAWMGHRTGNTRSRGCPPRRASAMPTTSCGETTASRWRWWRRRRPPSIPEVGQQQAKLYADCLEAMHGQRPVIFYTNGYKTRLWDDLVLPAPRRRRVLQEG